MFGSLISKNTPITGHYSLSILSRYALFLLFYSVRYCVVRCKSILFICVFALILSLVLNHMETYTNMTYVFVSFVSKKVSWESFVEHSRRTFVLMFTILKSKAKYDSTNISHYVIKVTRIDEVYGIYCTHLIQVNKYKFTDIICKSIYSLTGKKAK